jgi:ketosteroid isomerase-like protein
MPNIDHLNAVRRYLKTIEDGTFADIADLFTPDMVMEQLPNRIYPTAFAELYLKWLRDSKEAANCSPVRPTRSKTRS